MLDMPIAPLRLHLSDNGHGIRFEMNLMQPDNPGHTTRPQAPLQADRPCGLVRLVMVMLYDSVIVIAILMIAAAFALLLPFSNQTAGKDFAYTLYLLSAWFLYLAWCWRNSGMTLGMRAWGVQLVSDRGGPPGWWQCGLRFGAAGLSAAAAGMGYWWSLFDRQKLSWHDRLSQTRLMCPGKQGRPARSDGSTQKIDSSEGQ